MATAVIEAETCYGLVEKRNFQSHSNLTQHHPRGGPGEGPPVAGGWGQQVLSEGVGCGFVKVKETAVYQLTH